MWIDECNSGLKDNIRGFEFEDELLTIVSHIVCLYGAKKSKKQ